MATNIHRKIVLSVSGKEAENSFHGLSKTVRSLEKELKKLTPGTEEFKKKVAELKEAREHFSRIKNEIDLVNGKIEKAPNLLKRLTNGLLDFGQVAKEIFSANLISGFFNFLRGSATQSITELLKISDAMADVQKTTGMALEEVKGLWDAFDEMDTRTSKLDRLKIAEVGGRLGVPKEQMASFVQEVDKAYVALGDSFQGGLENVVDSLGKINGLFNETKGKSYAEAINEVGSALNELAASGTASEGNISDFALRVGALPDALKPSIDKVLGLGAAFEESGVDSQIAASGYSNFIKVAGENLRNFAHSMNMSYEEAQKLFNEKPEEFFLRFAQGMRDVPAEQTALIFNSLKIGTLEVQKAVGAAANRTDEFREAMARAGSAMQDATSLNEEFSKKNNNAAAIVEKLKNAFTDLFSSSTLINGFDWLIQLIGSITGVTKEAGEGVKTFKDRLFVLVKLISIALVSLVSYNLALTILALTTKNATQQTIIYNAITKTKTAIEVIAKGTTLLYAYAKAKLTGNTIRAAAAMKLYNAAVKANPIGIIVSVVMAAAAALYAFNREAENSIRILKKKEVHAKTTSDIQRQIAKEEATSLSELKRKTELYISVIKNANSSLEARKAAYEKLKAISPSFVGTLDEEFRATKRLEEANNNLIKKLKEAARVRAYKKLLDQYSEERVNAEQERIDAEFEAQEEENENKKRRQRNAQREKEAKDAKKIAGAWADKHDKSAMDMAKGINHEFDKKEKAKKLENTKNKEKNAEKKVDELTKRISNDKNLSKQLIEGESNSSNDEIGSNSIAASSSKSSNRPAINNEEEAKKKAEEEKRDLEDSLKRKKTAAKDELNLAFELEEEKLKIKQTSLEKEIEEAELARQKELTAQKEHGEAISENIKELEEKIKKAKSDEAEKNYTDALEKEKEAETKNKKLIAQAEETHQKKLAAIREKYRLQEHQKNIEAKQEQLEKDWQAKETEIQNITTLEEAKKKLSEMKHLELTATELRNIKTLEDAKKALRENAAREMLEAEIKAIEEQKAKLNELLKDPSLSPEALEQLNKDLNEVDSVLVRLKGTLQGKKEEDTAKKVTEQQDRRKNVDILT